MKWAARALLIGGAFLSLGFASLRPMVIYGDDNRRDLHEVSDQGLLEVARSTAAIFPNDILIPTKGNSFQVVTKAYRSEFNLCKEEAFYNQPTAGICSSFLVGPDLIATAGHCMLEGECKQMKFVFDFVADSRGKVSQKIPAESVYSCKEVLAQELNGFKDYALIRLDRDVSDRKPLKMAEAPVALGDSLTTIGYPSGLPLKITSGAFVRELKNKFFVANLDTYGGSSGSAVFNSRSLEVVGILVRGENDFIYDTANKCSRSNRCAMESCRGEDVINISFIKEKLQSL